MLGGRAEAMRAERRRTPIRRCEPSAALIAEFKSDWIVMLAVLTSGSLCGPTVAAELCAGGVLKIAVVTDGGQPFVPFGLRRLGGVRGASPYVLKRARCLHGILPGFPKSVGNDLKQTARDFDLTGHNVK